MVGKREDVFQSLGIVPLCVTTTLDLGSNPLISNAQIGHVSIMAYSISIEHVGRTKFVLSLVEN